jgi:hypothetical protein
MGICECGQHGLRGLAIGCRHVVVAARTGGPDPGATWWQCRLSTDDSPSLGAWLCRGCVEQYRLPPSVAVLDDPAFPVDLSDLFHSVCGACFEEWRQAHGGPEVRNVLR